MILQNKIYLFARFFILFILMMFFALKVNGATFYLTSAGAGSAQTPGNWNTNPAGGGTAAGNFTGNGDLFVIPLGINGVANGAWIFGSGSNGSVQLSVLGSLTINSGNTLTLEQKNAGVTTLNVESGGTIVFAGTSANQLVGLIGGNGTIANVIFNLKAGANLRTNNTTGVLGSNASISNTLLTNNINAGANFEFSGASQSMGFSLTTVNNLTLSGSGTKTWLAGLTTLTGSFTSNGTISTTVPAGLGVTGNFTIGSGTTVNAGAFTHTISGNWSNAGTFNSTGTVIFPASSGQSITGGGFNHVTFSGAGTKSLSGTIPVSGNWTNNGTVSSGTSTVSLVGSSAQSIEGSSATAFYNLSFNGSGLKTLTNASTVTNTLTLTSGILEIVNVDFLVNAFSGGSATSYIRTNGTGRVKQPILLNATKTFPIGNSAYNPAEITNDQESPSGIFRIRVADTANDNANANAKTVNRKWYITLEAAGEVNITAKFFYNSGETGGTFDRQINPKMGCFNGEWWSYENATVSGSNPYAFTSTQTIYDNVLYPNQYFTLGSDDAFNASKLSVSVFPANPTLGAGNSIITVRSLNSLDVKTSVKTSTAFNVTASNTTFTSGSSTGTILANTYEAEINNVTFTTATIDNSTASLTATRTSGETLSNVTSESFQVISGAIYEPIATGSWSTVTWRKSVDGGISWTSPATLPVSNVFGETDLIQIPVGITLTSNVNASFYSMIVLGTLDLNSGTLTLNHPINNDGGYDVHVHGIFKNSGGTFVNNDGTNGTTYPIEMHGGEYWHARDGGSIPIAYWESLSGTPTTCRVTGIVNTALTAGLNQSFQHFIWDNASQSIIQNLSADLNVTENLTLANGTINTGSNYFIKAAVGSISRTNGWIIGNFRMYVPNTTDATVLFPIGDVSSYAPVSVTFSGVTSGSGYINAYTTSGVPSYASGLSQTKYINRKWVLSRNGVNFSTYSININYNDADKVGSPTDLILRRLSTGTWFNTGGTSNTNTISASGQNAFGEFHVGESNCDTQFFWFGSVNTDWNNGSNWCSGSSPISSNNVVIPGGIAAYPTLNATSNCNNLTLQSGASIETGSNILNIYGNVDNSGTISSTSGTVNFKGSSAQTISGIGGSYTFHHLTIDNAAGVTLMSDDSIKVQGTLTINSGKILQIAAGKKMNAASVVNNAGVSGLILKASAGQPNASFKFSNAAENPVAATVEMYSKAYAANLDTLTGVYSNYQWQYIGVPVNNFTKHNPLLSGTYMRQFTESSSVGWGVASSVLESFRGYSITQSVGKTITWQGELFNQDKTINLSYTNGATFQGANFVANSFTSAVIIKDIVFGAGVDQNVYLFNTGKVENGNVIINEVNENTTSGQYINVPRLNAGAGGLPTTISSMQGFFVQTNALIGNTITIPYSATKSNVVPMRAPSQPTPNNFTLVISVLGKRYADKIWLFENSTCSNQFDNGWDGKKMFGTPAAPQLYMKSSQEFLQVQTTNSIDKTSIGINKGEDSEYTFILKAENKDAIFPDGLYLLDTKTNEAVEIQDHETEFSFKMIDGEDASERFVLTKSIEISTDIKANTEQIQVIVSGEQDKVYVQNKSNQELYISVTDLIGRVVMQSIVSANAEIRLTKALPTGLYAVNVRAGQFNHNQLVRIISQ